MFFFTEASYFNVDRAYRAVDSIVYLSILI